MTQSKLSIQTMYEVDDADRVMALVNVPPSSVGAPIPLIISDERRLVLAYYMQETEKGWDGTQIRIIGPINASEPIAIISFQLCYAHMFGPPNDEAFDGHPLASRGLHPYGAFEVINSSWIRRLERMNSIHPCHRPDVFWNQKHLIFDL